MTINCIEIWYDNTFTIKFIKNQGGRWICTDLHLMCIAQAHLTKKPNLQIALT